MEFGFSLVVRGREATPAGFLAIAEQAEALEVDSLWLSSHVILPPQERSGYGAVPGVAHPAHWREGYWEPFTLLAYLAARTERIRLGTSVVVLPMHNPIEIAKLSAQVDVLSAGRFTLGIGVGWFEEEFEVLGPSFRNRGARTDDALALMKKLWSEEPVTHDGPHYQVRDASFLPKPVQRPHPPIWIGGRGEHAIRRAARFGDALHPVRIGLDQLHEVRESLDRHCAALRRDPSEVVIAVKLPLTFSDPPPANAFATQGSPAQIIDAIAAYGEAGVSSFVFDFVPEEVDIALETMQRFAEDIRPAL